MSKAVDKATAELMSQNYLEVVCAPEFDDGTLEILAQRKNLRVIKMARIDRLAEFEKYRFVDFKSLIDGGLIAQQSAGNSIRTPADLKDAVTTSKGQEYRCERQPTAQEIDDMLFGWAVEHGVTSNSVIYVKNGVTVGIGTDVGAGPSLSVLETLADAYRVSKLRNQPLDSLHGLYLATLGAARCLDLDHVIGNFAVGKEADFTVLDAGGDTPVARRAARATDVRERLFALQLLGDARNVHSTWLLGEQAFTGAGCSAGDPAMA